MHRVCITPECGSHFNGTVIPSVRRLSDSAGAIFDAKLPTSHAIHRITLHSSLTTLSPPVRPSLKSLLLTHLMLI